MPLNLANSLHKVTNRPFKSAGEDRMVLHADGQMTNTTMVFHGRSERTNNLCLLTEIQWTQADASLHHVHDLEDKAFYVIEGELTVHTPNGDFGIAPGQLAWGPRGIQHGYSTGPEGARVLLIQVPGTQLSEFFAAAANIGDLAEDPAKAAARASWAEANCGVTFHLGEAVPAADDDAAALGRRRLVEAPAHAA